MILPTNNSLFLSRFYMRQNMSFNFTNKVRKNENILVHLFIWRKIYNTVLFVIISRGDQDN